MKLSFLLTAIGLAWLALVSCKQDVAPEPVVDGQSVAVAQAAGLELEFFVPDSLYAGYQAFTVQVTDQASGQPVSDLDLSVVPMMDMGTMMHSAPIEPIQAGEEAGQYQFQTVFIMPSNGGDWQLDLSLQRPEDDQPTQVSVPITVQQPEEARVRNFLSSDDSSAFFVSLVQPKQPIVGMNDFEITVHRRADMMNFPAVEDLSIEIEPEMPSMGHGSPDNVNPSHVGQGHYRGQVNFTMDGWWQVHVRIFRGDEQIGVTDFNVTFMAG